MSVKWKLSVNILCEKCQALNRKWLKIVNYFRKKPHLRCLKVFWIRFWVPATKKLIQFMPEPKVPFQHELKINKSILLHWNNLWIKKKQYTSYNPVWFLLSFFFLEDIQYNHFWGYLFSSLILRALLIFNLNYKELYGIM